jgi:hypothetical protein
LSFLTLLLDLAQVKTLSQVLTTFQGVEMAAKDFSQRTRAEYTLQGFIAELGNGNKGLIAGHTVLGFAGTFLIFWGLRG